MEPKLITREEKKLREQIAFAISMFDCPECGRLDRCINSVECRLYAQGRKDAVAIALGQQSTPSLTDAQEL